MPPTFTSVAKEAASVAKEVAKIIVQDAVRNHVLRANDMSKTPIQLLHSTFYFCIYMLRCPTFRADVITAVKARSLDIFLLGVLKIFTDRSPCNFEDMMVLLLHILLAFEGAFICAIACAWLFCHLTGQTAPDVRKDGSGVNGEARNTNELQGKEEISHDKH